MKKLVHALAVLPLLAATAAAEPTQPTQPTQLSDNQLDKVSAGFLEIDVSNTSLTAISIFGRPFLTEPTGNFLTCPGCFLLIVTPTFSVGSQFGPTPGVTAPP